jgi:hypothetical protein
LENRKAVKDNPNIKTVKPRIALCREIPVDFIAANSYFSEKLPKTIKEVTKILSGRTSGISRGETNHRNFKTIKKSRSLPASSLIYNQIVCKTKMNIKIMKTLKNVFK